MYIAPAFTTEILTFYGVILKKDAIAKDLKLDDTEDILTLTMSINDALDKIVDMKSKYAILYYLKEFNNERY